ncbi:hypothetical protein JW859_01765 [bacterium]|nr:hypothetical protein [bacterium]
MHTSTDNKPRKRDRKNPISNGHDASAATANGNGNGSGSDARIEPVPDEAAEMLFPGADEMLAPVDTVETALEDDLARLAVWAAACGITPAGGWFRATGLTKEQLRKRLKADQAESRRARLFNALAPEVGRELIVRLAGVRLTEFLLLAEGPKELLDALRLLDKLPAPAAGDAPVEDDTAGLNLVQVIEETRRVLDVLEDDPEVQRQLDAAQPGGSQ